MSDAPTGHPRFQRFLDWCLPPAARQDKRWIGWLLLAGAILIVLFILFSILVLILLIDTLAQHGAGALGGEAAIQPGGPNDFSQGISIAHWWLFGLLSVVPLSLFRLWWHFGRSDRPGSASADLKAAQAGDGAAAFRLGQHYLHRDPSSARAWLSQAAHAGIAEAMVELARDLREGRGGPRDLASARGWLTRAAAAGAPEAKGMLAQVEAQLGDRYSEQGC